jgi:hypothetical protein
MGDKLCIVPEFMKYWVPWMILPLPKCVTNCEANADRAGVTHGAYEPYWSRRNNKTLHLSDICMEAKCALECRSVWSVDDMEVGRPRNKVHIYCSIVVPNYTLN